jgi:ABC-type bacteriocin/lantibiotic exporter with double-glycine peptidase domain
VERGLRLDIHFEQSGKAGCGVCAPNVLFKKHGLPGRIFPYTDVSGTSSWKLISELRKGGLRAKPKTISICNLKPWSILWYPPKGRCRGGHYIVVGQIKGDKVAIYDSAKKKPYWEKLSVLQGDWYRWYRNRWCGWVVEVSKPNGSA